MEARNPIAMERMIEVRKESDERISKEIRGIWRLKKLQDIQRKKLKESEMEKKEMKEEERERRRDVVEEEDDPT